MKGTLKSFKKVFREGFEKKLEDLDRERRASVGNYDNEDDMSGVSYGDRYGEAVELEDVDRVRRAQPGEYNSETMFDEAGFDDNDSFKGIGAHGASQLSKGAAATASKSDPKLVVQTMLDTVKQQLANASPSTKSNALTQLKKILSGPGANAMPSMGSLTPTEVDDPADDPEKKKRKGKGHAAPSETDVGDTGGGPAGSFMAAGYDPLSDDDPKNRLNEKTPPGMEKMVKTLKKDPNIEDPWAVAWAAYNKAKDRRR